MIFADLLYVDSVLGTTEKTFGLGLGLGFGLGLGLGACPSYSHLGLIIGEGEEKSITEHLPCTLT